MSESGPPAVDLVARRTQRSRRTATHLQHRPQLQPRSWDLPDRAAAAAHPGRLQKTPQEDLYLPKIYQLSKQSQRQILAKTLLERAAAADPLEPFQKALQEDRSLPKTLQL